MAAAKKTKIQASEVGVGRRTLEGVLIDLAQQVKANDERCAHRTASIEERSARAEERSARAEEMAALALKTIAAVSQDLQALTKEMRAANLRNDARFGALEKTSGA
jgi:hypothetical protein